MATDTSTNNLSLFSKIKYIENNIKDLRNIHIAQSNATSYKSKVETIFGQILTLKEYILRLLRQKKYNTKNGEINKELFVVYGNNKLFCIVDIKLNFVNDELDESEKITVDTIWQYLDNLMDENNLLVYGYPVYTFNTQTKDSVPPPVEASVKVSDLRELDLDKGEIKHWDDYLGFMKEIIKTEINSYDWELRREFPSIYTRSYQAGNFILISYRQLNGIQKTNLIDNINPVIGIIREVNEDTFTVIPCFVNGVALNIHETDKKYDMHIFPIHGEYLINLSNFTPFEFDPKEVFSLIKKAMFVNNLDNYNDDGSPFYKKLRSLYDFLGNVNVKKSASIHIRLVGEKDENIRMTFIVDGEEIKITSILNKPEDYSLNRGILMEKQKGSSLISVISSYPVNSSAHNVNLLIDQFSLDNKQFLYDYEATVFVLKDIYGKPNQGYEDFYINDKSHEYEKLFFWYGIRERIAQDKKKIEDRNKERDLKRNADQEAANKAAQEKKRREEEERQRAIEVERQLKLHRDKKNKEEEEAAIKKREEEKRQELLRLEEERRLQEQNRLKAEIQKRQDEEEEIRRKEALRQEASESETKRTSDKFFLTQAIPLNLSPEDMKIFSEREEAFTLSNMIQDELLDLRLKLFYHTDVADRGSEFFEKQKRLELLIREVEKRKDRINSKSIIVTTNKSNNQKNLNGNDRRENGHIPDTYTTTNGNRRNTNQREFKEQREQQQQEEVLKKMTKLQNEIDNESDEVKKQSLRNEYKIFDDQYRRILNGEVNGIDSSDGVSYESVSFENLKTRIEEYHNTYDDTVYVLGGLSFQIYRKGFIESPSTLLFKANFNYLIFNMPENAKGHLYSFVRIKPNDYNKYEMYGIHPDKTLGFGFFDVNVRKYEEFKYGATGQSGLKRTDFPLEGLIHIEYASGETLFMSYKIPDTLVNLPVSQKLSTVVSDKLVVVKFNIDKGKTGVFRTGDIDIRKDSYRPDTHSKMFEITKLRKESVPIHKGLTLSLLLQRKGSTNAFTFMGFSIL